MREVSKGVFINPDLVGMVKEISEKQTLIVLIGRNEIVINQPSEDVIKNLGLEVDYTIPNFEPNIEEEETVNETEQ